MRAILPRTCRVSTALCASAALCNGNVCDRKTRSSPFSYIWVSSDNLNTLRLLRMGMVPSSFERSKATIVPILFFILYKFYRCSKGFLTCCVKSSINSIWRKLAYSFYKSLPICDWNST